VRLWLNITAIGAVACTAVDNAHVNDRGLTIG